MKIGTPDAWAADYEIVMEKKVDHLFLQPFPNPPGIDDDAESGNNFIALARKHNPDAQAWLIAIKTENVIVRRDFWFLCNGERKRAGSGA